MFELRKPEENVEERREGTCNIATGGVEERQERRVRPFGIYHTLQSLLLLNQTLEMALHEQPEVVGFKTTVEIAIMEDNLGNTDVHSGKKAEFFIPL